MGKDTVPARASGASKRGFASMDPERQREIARQGGASVPSEKRSFSQDRDLATRAGRKGGKASGGNSRAEAPQVEESASSRPNPQREF